MTHKNVIFIFLCIGTLVLFIINLILGAVNIPVHSVLAILLGNGEPNDIWTYIILHFRLPQAIIAILAGGLLALCGLLLQALFQNPLADPSILGVSSGAGVGVALVMLLFGGGLTIGALSFTGVLAVFIGALIGSISVTLLMLLLAKFMKSNTLLLIAGVMIGYLSSSIIILFNFFASSDGMRAYIQWGMGNFSSVTNYKLIIFAIISIGCVFATFILAKPLNAMALGAYYAQNLGIDTKKFRNIVLLITGIMTASVTCFCGPIAFIGLVVPHLAHLLFRSDDYHILLPATFFIGSNIALLCNAMCTILPGGYILPINVITPIIGVPVIFYIMLRKSNKYER